MSTTNPKTGATLVESLAQQGVVQRGEISNPLSGTRTTVYFPGARAVYLQFLNQGGAVTAKELRAVFNALSDGDADAKVLTAGSRKIVPLAGDDTVPFPDNNKCTRMDIYSDAAAEAGTTKVVYEGVSP